ncbi:MAG: hypothetical protein KJ964_14125 [Verrucomicrobia bacterium]|nr:hypothetical protein [Verrucomicrobiota bacterium]MBU1734778.1 hypothetical protein [Verrucomicrobiota bacterium]MBU1857797.1 hypothetical protein [Verrucomicrobiota bacterium]
MTRVAVIGMTLIVLAFAGCIDNREIESLKSENASLSDKIASLNKRVKAVEGACLQLNARFESRDQTATGSRPARDEIEWGVSKPDLNARLTRVTFSQRMVDMTMSQVMAKLGKPDNVSDESGIQQWIYNKLELAKESGGVEQSPALIVFKHGSVLRAELSGKVSSSSEPKASESDSAVVQTDQ